MRFKQLSSTYCRLFATEGPQARRSYSAANHHVTVRAAPKSDFQGLADGFIAEYELAGIKLDPLARRQLCDWYTAELQRAEAEAGGADAATDAAGSKDPPPLMQSRRGIPQLTVLWDLESIKPFTQQHQPGRSGPADAADGPAQQRARASGRVSRLAAAGLPGAASSPDLIAALDQLCRTLNHYGTVHAVHLFLRESTVGKAPVLRRQVEQLRTWVDAPGPQDAEDARSGSGIASVAATPPEADRLEVQSNGHQRASGGASSTIPAVAGPMPASSRPGDGPGTGSSAAGLTTAAARRRLPGGLLQNNSVHDCPLCRSAHPSRLALLRHFVAAHQTPLLAATAVDTRTLIMWTRGRAVGLPMVVPETTRAGATEDTTSAPQGSTERVVVSPEEFTYARQLLMRGRHLDELLASAPVAVYGSTYPKAAMGAGAGVQPAPGVARTQPSGAITNGSGASGVDAVTAAGPKSFSGRGLHLHMLPAGQPAEAAAAAMRGVAEALAALQVFPVPSPLGNSGGRVTATQRQARRAVQPRRGQKASKRGRAEPEPDQGPIVCLCLISDAEGLEQTLADLRGRDVLSIAVTRVTKVPSADVSLRWWAVQGAEYRLGAAILQ